MKKSSIFTWGKFCQLLIVLLLLSMAMVMVPVSADTHAANAIWVDPGSITDLKKCDYFNVTVMVNLTTFTPPATGMYGFEYKLLWNGTVVSLVARTKHNPYWENSSMVVKDTIGTWGDGRKYHWLAISALMPAPAVSGVIVLCTYKFHVDYQPYYPEPDFVGTLDLLDDKLKDDRAADISHATFDGTYEVPYMVDNTPPTIGVPSRTPSGSVLPSQNVTVSVNVTDTETGVKNVTLSYTINNGTSWENITMNYNSTSGLYVTATPIPGQPALTWVKYKIIAYDNRENNATKDGTEPYCAYQVIPEFLEALIMPLFMVATLVAVILGKKALLRKRRSSFVAR